jgi:hypothetical protein
MRANLQVRAWKSAVLEALSNVDNDAVSFIHARRVSIQFGMQGTHTHAIWRPGNRIYLNSTYFSPETDPHDPLVQSVLVHEVRHLQQGFFKALSVYGEMDAWQLGFRVLHQLTGQPFHPKLVELMSLPLCLDRDVLHRAQLLMQVYAGKHYRADLLPLYPWGLEIKYRLGYKPPTGNLHAP